MSMLMPMPLHSGTTQPMGSPLWYVEKLEQKLDTQARQVKKLEGYYEGLQVNFVMSTPKYKDYFKQMIEAVSDNWMPIVVDAVCERLNVQGFRFGTDQSDDDAWEIWQYNNLDGLSDALHTTVATTGIGYQMVWASGDDRRPVLITPEHPSETYVAFGPRGERVAAIKRWYDEWGEITRLNLYLPDRIYKYYKNKRFTVWVPWFGDRDGMAELDNPLGVVPIIPFRNRTTLKVGSHRSEIADVLSTQDQINKLVMDLLVASEFASFRQRWITGIEIPTNDDGTPKANLQMALDRILTFEDSEIKLGEFSATDLRNFTLAIESRIQSLASRSRTPPHYLLGQTGTFPSGESLKATETGLIAKTKRRQKEFDDPHEESMRLAFAVLDDPRANIRNNEVIWADPESRTEAEHIDALVKKLSIYVPIQQLWTDAGYTPPQQDRFKEMLLEEALIRAAAQRNGVTSAGQPGAGSQGQEGPPAAPGASEADTGR